MKEELYRKLDEDGGEKMIFKMARDRTEDGRDVKRSAVIKDNNGMLITESVEDMGGKRQGAAERRRSSKLHRAPELSQERGRSGGDRTGRSGNSNAQDEKGKATGEDEVRLDMLEMAGEVGVKWTGRLLNGCMHEGRTPKEWRMGLIVPIWKRQGDVHDPGKYRGITLLSQVLKQLERDLDARIGRNVEGDFREEQQGFRKAEGTADGM